MFVRPWLLNAILLVSFAAAVGCADSEAPPENNAAPAEETVQLTNAVCPIMGGKATPEITVQWQGKTVGFCCEECIPEWNALSDEEKAEKLAEVAESTAEDTDEAAHHEHSNHNQSS